MALAQRQRLKVDKRRQYKMELGRGRHDSQNSPTVETSYRCWIIRKRRTYSTWFLLVNIITYQIQIRYALYCILQLNIDAVQSGALW